MRHCLIKLKTAAVIAAMAVPSMTKGQSYVTGDFHQHTTYTDGSYTFGHMMEKNNQFGLQWWANSEHGGAWDRWGLFNGLDLSGPSAGATWANKGIILKGKANGDNMYRWQSLTEWSFSDLLLYRRVFPNKLIIQAYEMNVPGHEHASMGLIGNQFAASNPDVKALATFEYLFDATDTDDSQPLGTSETKMTTNNHAKAVAAVKWLQDNYSTQSWLIPAHPERFRYESGTANYHGWNIEHFRDMNNAAPDVFFGFESIPGHQASPNRCEYHAGRGNFGSYGICTYGGVGWMSAKVGGLWDALLSEGRHFWLFSNSDCHLVTNADGSFANADFYPGEYQKTYTHVSGLNAQAVVNGLRSGNSWCVNGDLIDSLQFTVGTVMMGQTAQTSSGKVTITVRVHNPQTPNNNIYSTYTTPELDHFDIIEGVVGAKITPPATVPADGVTGYSNEYKCDTVTTTQVIARFGKTAAAADPNGISTVLWTNEGNGYYSATYEVEVPQGETRYYRLRGTNHPLSTANETDACGNPLPDSLMGTNTAAKAFADLWFYTNPLYVQNSENSIIPPSTPNDKVMLYPNPAENMLYLKSELTVKNANIINAAGQIVLTVDAKNGQIDIASLAIGVYTLQLTTEEGIVSKTFVKQ
jgi:hypothetical protein